MNITAKEFRQLSDFIRQNYGINLKEEKKTLVVGRLHKVLEEIGFSSFTDYYNYLMSDKTGERVKVLVDKITTNHTYFMREATHFCFLQNQVLPYLESTLKNKDLRIWSAACSTGEEAYTLAMILDEFFGREKIYWDTKILATDISSKVLATAERGIYSAESVKTLPKNWVNHYMKKLDEENYVFTDLIKKEIIYRKFNLMQEQFPFKKPFDVIFLRNVLIYFDQYTKENLIEKMYSSLKPGGYLFIGHSEAINRTKTKFQYIQPAVYRKI